LDSDPDREFSSLTDILATVDSRLLMNSSVEVKSPRRWCLMSSNVEHSSGVAIF
jgi:hypothetical protein